MPREDVQASDGTLANCKWGSNLEHMQGAHTRKARQAIHRAAQAQVLTLTERQ